MKENTNSRVRCRLRWHLIAAWAIVLTAAVGAVFFTLTARIRVLLFDTEVEKLRPAAQEVAKLCADFYMSPSEGKLKMGFVKIMQDFPDACYVLFQDRSGKIHWQSDNKTVDPIQKRVARKDPRHKPLYFIETPGEIYVDIGAVTDTQPQLPVHVGFAMSLLHRRMSTLLWNHGAISLVVLAGGLIGGLLFSIWLTRPVVKLSSLTEKFSLGDMSVRLNLKSKGEIGRVYHSLERLRESMLYALRRLNSSDEPRGDQMEPQAPEQGEMAKGDGTWASPR